LSQRIGKSYLWFWVTISLSLHVVMFATVVIVPEGRTMNPLVYHSALVVDIINVPAEIIADDQSALPLSVQPAESRILLSGDLPKDITVKKHQNKKRVTQKNAIQSAVHSQDNEAHTKQVTPPAPALSPEGLANKTKTLTGDKNEETQKQPGITPPDATTLIARSLAAVRNDPSLGDKVDEDFTRYFLEKQREPIKHLLPALTGQPLPPQMGEFEEFRTTMGGTMLTVHLGSGKKLCVDLSSQDFSTVDITENPAAWMMFAC